MKILLKTGFNILLLFCSFKAFSLDASLRGYYPSFKESDVVELITSPYGSPDYTGFTKTYTTEIHNHSFRFVIQMEDAPLQIVIHFKDKYGKLTWTDQYLAKAISGYYIESRDEISIFENNKEIEYTGKGSSKFKVLQQVKAMGSKAFAPLGISFVENPFLNIKIADSLIKEQLAVVRDNKHVLSDAIYTIYRANLIGGWIGLKYSVRYIADSTRKRVIDSLRHANFQDPFSQSELTNINNSAYIIYADQYTRNIRSKYEFDSCYSSGREFSDHKYYLFLERHYSGKILERLITDILFRDRVEAGDNSDLINDALSRIKNPDFRMVLNTLKNHRSPGADAFNFSLTDENGKMHTMEEFKGQVVFLDFWFTGCGNCIQVKPYIDKLEDYFRNKPVSFLSVNLDKTKAEWLKSVQQGKYTTKLGMNLFTGGNAFESAISKYYSVDGGPTLILIDRCGKLMAIPADPRIDNGDNIRRLITAQLKQ